MTYAGALKILGKNDHPRLERLNTLMGGILLLSPLAPVAWLGGLWGLVDQKNEAASTVRQLLDAGLNRLLKTGGLERHELIAAAHTTLVGSAFFEVMRESVDKKDYDSLKITLCEKVSLTAGTDGLLVQPVLERLLLSRTPIPSASVGYYENLDRIQQHLFLMATETQRFIAGLAQSAGQERLVRTLDNTEKRDHVVSGALERYKSHYVKMAADVPELFVWATLGEHSSTRAKIATLRDEVNQAFRAQSRALASTQALLATVSINNPPQDQTARQALMNASRGLLREPIVPADAFHGLDDIIFPTVEEIYVEPQFRHTVFDKESQPANDNWWREVPVSKNLSIFLAAHLMSPTSASIPLLLLGHPGAGKSLLTKVLAARIPSDSYTVVRVALRRVDATAPVYHQIQQALDEVTHGRTDWPTLVEQSKDTLRVVLLDGLDELLQATANDRAGYLQEIMDFQQREADQNHPVVVIVTSRTVVTDNVRIPRGLPIARLEEFSDNHIKSWLQTWRRANQAHIEDGTVGELSAEVALGYPSLARQPLLLLMLALYAADPNAPILAGKLSTTALYERLLTNFVRREVLKQLQGRRDEEVDDAVYAQLWRLGVTAFGMFNRGRQDIADNRLGDDLVALGEPNALRADSQGVSREQIGQQTIGRFFFVYAAEANVHRPDGVRRSYEFLHATFGEYLVAKFTVQMLRQLPAVRAGFGALPGQVTDDNLLYALLSHHPLSARQSILDFVSEISGADAAVSALQSTIDMLIRSSRQRRINPVYASYQASSNDELRRLAAYSANLLLLRVSASESYVPIEQIAPPDTTAGDWWESTVNLWRAGLDPSGWMSLHDALDVRPDPPSVKRRLRSSPVSSHIAYLRLIGDREAEADLRAGLALHAGIHPDDDGHNEYGVLVSVLAEGFAQPSGSAPARLKHLAESHIAPAGLRGENLCRVIANYLYHHSINAKIDDIAVLVRLCLENRPPQEPVPELAIPVAIHPQLVQHFGELRNPTIYIGSSPESPIWVSLVFAAAASNPALLPGDISMLEEFAEAAAAAAGIRRQRVSSAEDAMRWVRYLLKIDQVVPSRSTFTAVKTSR
ncbi:ATP-binding protein [Micromonospora sp. NPDC126480]|uniref:NACHT domain-containing protein n=1 Tax=Micromonospora sp. NPDC126480 TaxID=3155312 RepID=UPI00331BCB26